MPVSFAGSQPNDGLLDVMYAMDLSEEKVGRSYAFLLLQKDTTSSCGLIKSCASQRNDICVTCY